MSSIHFRKALAAAVAAYFASGCASVVNGKFQSVRIDSLPTGAALTVLQTGQELVAPADVELRRDAVYTVQARLDGYEPTMGYIDRVSSHVVLGNVVFGGLIGASIDADSGAGYALSPDPLIVRLLPLGSPPIPDAPPVARKFHQPFPRR